MAKIGVIEEFVSPLLKHLERVETEAKKYNHTYPQIKNTFTEVRSLVNIAKEVLGKAKSSECELVDTFGQIEKHLDCMFDDDARRITTELKAASEKTKEMIKMIKKMKPLKEIYDDVAPKLPSKQHKSEDENHEILISFDEEKIIKLNPNLGMCFYSLAVFPEKTKLRKRLLIYWWIGLGLVQTGRIKTARDIGEIIFNDLVNLGVLRPVEGHTSKVVDACIIATTVHKQLISAANRNNFLHDISNSKNGSDHSPASTDRSADYTCHNYAAAKGSTHGSDHSHAAAKGKTNGSDHNHAEDKIGFDHYRVCAIRTNKGALGMLVNLDQKYVKSKCITKMLKNSKDLHAMQMGLCSKEPHHIEVDKTDFLSELNSSLTYLSLQGVSRITELPDSIGNLVNLIVLDLRACHNLEKLPKRIKEMNKLMHLDVSMCYLLDHLPKWVGSLSNLEVLKGFVIGSTRSRDSCRLGDLAKLVKLRKLSMTIGRESNVESDELQSIKVLTKLHSLTITWRVGGCKDKTKKIEPPENLEKLGFRCYPEKEMPQWFKPAALTNLKRLYIRGGEIERFADDAGWIVETLRLRFLHKFEMSKSAVRMLFEKLTFVEWEQCEKFDAVNGYWRKERDDGGDSSNPGPSLNDGSNGMSDAPLLSGNSASGSIGDPLRK